MGRAFFLAALGMGVTACGPSVPVDDGPQATTEASATSDSSAADGIATSGGSSTGAPAPPATSDGSTDAVGPDGAMQAAAGLEDLTGTITIGVWAPHHPTVAIIDLSGPATTLQGVIELELCTTTNDVPCE